MSWEGRPVNETAEDRARQDNAARVIERLWNRKVMDLSPISYKVDWAILGGRDNDIKAFGEYKFRHGIAWDTYSDLILSLAKYDALRHYADLAGVPPMMFWEFEKTPGTLAYMDVSEVTGRRVVWGGNDRSQNGDKEPVVLLPVHLMTLVKYE